MARAALLLIAALWCGAKSAEDCGLQPADIVFINDESGSVGASNFQKTLRFIETVVNGFDIGPFNAQIGLITFSSATRLQFDLNTYSNKEDIVRRVKSTNFDSGGTNTAGAINFARDVSFTEARGMRDMAAHIAIVITDGDSNDASATTAAARSLRSKGITIFSIGVGDGPDQAELRSIASDPDSNHVFSVSNFNSLSKIKESLKKRACEAKPAFVCSGEADVMFLLDKSETVGLKNLKVALQFVLNLTQDFRIGTDSMQFGVDTFSEEFTHLLQLSQRKDQSRLQNAMSSISLSPGSDTSIGNAIKMMRENSFTRNSGHTRDVPKIAIALTSGQSRDKELTFVEAEKARDSGIFMVVIGVGPGVDEAELSSVATGEGTQNVYMASAFEALNTLKGYISSNLCNKLEKKSSTSSSPKLQSGAMADIVFLLDSSGPIGEYNFTLLRDFVRTYVKDLEIGQDKIRVGIEKFSSRPYNEFNLNSFSNREELLDAIDRIEFRSGGSDTAAAITYMDKSMFKTANGDRPRVPNIAIVMTDGKSNKPEATKAAAARARANGVNIFVIGVGNVTSKAELTDIASEPRNTHVLTVTDFTKLSSIKNAFQAQTFQVMPATLAPPMASVALATTSEPETCKDELPDCSRYRVSWCSDKVWAMEKCRRFCGYCGSVSWTPVSSNKCFYKGGHYEQGEKWDDGCAYECECADASTGQYVCYNKCPSYFNLPRECKLIPRPGKCCREPDCEFGGTYDVKKVQEHCEYNGRKYLQGQVWSEGCEYECICVDASTGFYACQSKCSQYDSLPGNCKLVTPPGECCKKPDCEFQTQVGKFSGSGGARGPATETDVSAVNSTCVDNSPDCDTYHLDLCTSPTNRSFALENCRKFCNVCDSEGVSTPSDVCIYQGRSFKQGQKWYDGCQKVCVCDDAETGYVRCEDRCPDYLNLPSGCSLVNVSGQCCLSLQCDTQATFTGSQTDADTVGAVPMTQADELSTLPPHASVSTLEPSQTPAAGQNDSFTSTRGNETSPEGTMEVVPKLICDPAEEGQPTTLTCIARTDNCSNLFVLNWLADTREVATCTSDLCGSQYTTSVQFNASITAVSSRLAISNVSRLSPFNMETHWTCALCGDKNKLECDKLQVYALPENPECTVREDMDSDIIYSVTVSCSTTKVYPTAKCSFYKINNNGTPEMISTIPEYDQTETGDSLVYYSSRCSVSVAVEDLGEGTHSFQGYIYPDVTGGEDLVDAITPNTTVNLYFPQASHSCSPEMFKGFFSGNTSQCNCSLTDDGYPRGIAHWYKGDEPRAQYTDNILEVTLSNDQYEIYTCEAESLLGRSLGSTLKVNFLVASPARAAAPGPAPGPDQSAQTGATATPGVVAATVVAAAVLGAAAGLAVFLVKRHLSQAVGLSRLASRGAGDPSSGPDDYMFPMEKTGDKPAADAQSYGNEYETLPDVTSTFKANQPPPATNDSINPNPYETFPGEAPAVGADANPTGADIRPPVPAPRPCPEASVSNSGDTPEYVGRSEEEAPGVYDDGTSGGDVLTQGGDAEYVGPSEEEAPGVYDDGSSGGNVLTQGGDSEYFGPTDEEAPGVYDDGTSGRDRPTPGEDGNPPGEGDQAADDYMVPAALGSGAPE